MRENNAGYGMEQIAAAATYDHGQSTKPLAALERLINDTYGKPDLRAEIEKQMARQLEGEAPLAAKQVFCRHLSVIGTDASLPALAKLLAGEDPHAAEIACYALNLRPSPAVDAVLREALARAKGSALLAVITLLGDRRDEGSADALAPLAASEDAAVAEAAAAALGKIANGPAVKILTDLHRGGDGRRRAAAAHACLQAAQELAAGGNVAEATALYERLSGPNEPPHIRRGARRGLAALPRGGHDGFVSLFDGKTFAGWEGNLQVFRIEDGAIVGGSLKENVARNEFLCTTKEYDNFELRLKFKVLGAGANAGVQVRSRRIPNHHEVSGYQADLGAGWWGNLYDESRRNRNLAVPEQGRTANAVKLDDWNDYRIRCQGRRIQLWINGIQTVDYIEPDEKIEQTGLIGLQIHGGPPSEAWYKDITLRPLAPSGG
jgi:hypothetical protein